MIINQGQAEELVLEFINKDRADDRKLIIVDISKNEHGWTFLYDYKEQIESKYKRFRLAGSHPIFVFENSTIEGRMYFLSPKEDLDEIINRHGTYEKMSKEQSADQEKVQHIDGQSEVFTRESGKKDITQPLVGNAV